MTKTRVGASPNCLLVNADVHPGKDFWVLLSSDRHWDNAHSNHALQKRHFRDMEERDGYWIDLGDLFCVMQGKWDKRSSQTQLRPEHRGDNYTDRVVDTAVDFFSPWAARCLMLGKGNHETSFQKRHETDLTDRLAKRLNEKMGSTIHIGGYTNAIIFRFDLGKRTSRKMWTTHGYGGGGPVTKDVIQANRQGVFLDSFDIVASGHTHDAWIMPQQTLKLSEKGKIWQGQRLHIKVPSYKDEWGTGEGGWCLEKGHPPKPTGAIWLRFFVRSDVVYTEATIAR